MRPPIQTYSVRDTEFDALVLPRLVDNVFHVTRYSSFESIVKSGQIDPNSDGHLGDAFPGSASSYGRCKGFVCLFDFRQKSQEDISCGIGSCDFRYKLEDRLAFLLPRAEAFPKLIPGSEAYKDTDCQGRLWVPKVECWHPGALPLRLAAQVLDVCVSRTPIEPGTWTDRY